MRAVRNFIYFNLLSRKVTESPQLPGRDGALEQGYGVQVGFHLFFGGFEVCIPLGALMKLGSIGGGKISIANRVPAG